jgi:hypothetical protein
VGDVAAGCSDRVGGPVDALSAKAVAIPAPSKKQSAATIAITRTLNRGSAGVRKPCGAGEAIAVIPA